MPLSEIGYGDLRNANCALLDTTSVRLLTDLAVGAYLTSTSSRFVGSDPLPQNLIHRGVDVNRVLDILARMIAYDFLVVDGAVLDSALADMHLSYSSVLGGQFVRRTAIPDGVYHAAAANVLQAADLIRFDPASSHWLQDDYFIDGVEKRHLDDRFPDVRELRWLRDSDQSAGRALLYTELGRFARVPLFLSPEKEQKLAHIGRRFVREALRLVQDTTDRAVLSRLHNAVYDSYNVKLELDWPPLVRYIIQIAYVHDVSIFEAVLRIRDLPSAAAFRTWLGDLQRLLLSDTSSSALAKASKIVTTLGRVTEEWSKECGAHFGVRYRHARANLSALPGIGTVLKLVGRETITLKDPLLGVGADYLTFISEWYGPAAEEPNAG